MASVRVNDGSTIYTEYYVFFDEDNVQLSDIQHYLDSPNKYPYYKTNNGYFVNNGTDPSGGKTISHIAFMMPEHVFIKQSYRFGDGSKTVWEDSNNAFQGIFTFIPKTDSTENNQDSIVDKTTVGKTSTSGVAKDEVYSVTVTDYRVNNKVFQGLSYKDNDRKISSGKKPHYGFSKLSGTTSFKNQLQQTGWGLTKHNPILLEENISKYGGWSYKYYVIKNDNRLYCKATKDSDNEVCLGYVGPQARLYAIKQTPVVSINEDKKVWLSQLNTDYDGRIQLTSAHNTRTPEIEIAWVYSKKSGFEIDFSSFDSSVFDSSIDTSLFELKSDKHTFVWNFKQGNNIKNEIKDDKNQVHFNDSVDETYWEWNGDGAYNYIGIEPFKSGSFNFCTLTIENKLWPSLIEWKGLTPSNTSYYKRANIINKYDLNNPSNTWLEVSIKPTFKFPLMIAHEEDSHKYISLIRKQAQAHNNNDITYNDPGIYYNTKKWDGSGPVVANNGSYSKEIKYASNYIVRDNGGDNYQSVGLFWGLELQHSGQDVELDRYCLLLVQVNGSGQILYDY